MLNAAGVVPHRHAELVASPWHEDLVHPLPISRSVVACVQWPAHFHRPHAGRPGPVGLDVSSTARWRAQGVTGYLVACGPGAAGQRVQRPEVGHLIQEQEVGGPLRRHTKRCRRVGRVPHPARQAGSGVGDVGAVAAVAVMSGFDVGRVVVVVQVLVIHRPHGVRASRLPVPHVGEFRRAIGAHPALPAVTDGPTAHLGEAGDGVVQVPQDGQPVLVTRLGPLTPVVGPGFLVNAQRRIGPLGQDVEVGGGVGSFQGYVCVLVVATAHAHAHGPHDQRGGLCPDDVVGLTVQDGWAGGRHGYQGAGAGPLGLAVAGGEGEQAGDEHDNGQREHAHIHHDYLLFPR